jgi:hypothetical protein
LTINQHRFLPQLSLSGKAHPGNIGKGVVVGVVLYYRDEESHDV